MRAVDRARAAGRRTKRSAARGHRASTDRFGVRRGPRWLAALLCALALLGHFAQGFHFLQHAHAVVDGKLVHADPACGCAHTAPDERTPPGERLAASHEHDECGVPPHDRVREGQGGAPILRARPPRASDTVLATRPVARARDVLAFAPKHSPPLPRSC